MFVKKDLRKIPTILAEAAETARALESPPSENDDPNIDASSKKRKHEELSLLTELRLSRRAPEFNGSLSILCSPQNIPSLRHLVSLSLYDCGLKSLDGIGMLASPVLPKNQNVDDPEDQKQLVCCPNLKELNVGRNPLRELPTEISKFASLTSLWCDDCSIEGPLPPCIMALEKLEVLRLSNNKITKIPSSVGLDGMKNLKVLCLDGNEIRDVPEELTRIESLESILLRQNQIETLPEGLPGSNLPNLTLLHLSSNKLTSLPNSTTQCTSLCALYVNGNALTSLPSDGWKNMEKLKSFNLGSNKIDVLPDEFMERFGEPDLTTGDCTKDESCTVKMDQNPVVEKARSMTKEKAGSQ